MMDVLNTLMYILVLFVKSTDSNRGSFCIPQRKPVLTVCNDQEVTRTRTVYIDTFGIRYNRQISCDCAITPSRQPLILNLNIVNSARGGKNSIEFMINEIEVGKYYQSAETNITGATKLLFSTLKNRAKGGVCLAVYTYANGTFNISCTRATNEKTSTLTIPSSLAHTSRTTEYKTLKPIHSTEQTSKELGIEENYENVNEVTVILSCVSVIMLVIIACLLLYVKRLRRLHQINSQDENYHTCIAQISGMVTHADQVQQECVTEPVAEISLNAYERLNMYENAEGTGEMYEQLEVANA